MLEPAEMKRWQRLTDAMLEHAAFDDPEAFAQVVGLLDRAIAQLPSVAATLREDSDDTVGSVVVGYSWSDLARALGVTKGAAWQRFGSHRIAPASE